MFLNVLVDAVLVGRSDSWRDPYDVAGHQVFCRSCAKNFLGIRYLLHELCLERRILSIQLVREQHSCVMVEVGTGWQGKPACHLLSRESPSNVGELASPPSI